MDPKFIEELRQKYIKNPPEGMTAKLVRNMTDSDLLDMSCFRITAYCQRLSGKLRMMQMLYGCIAAIDIRM